MADEPGTVLPSEGAKAVAARHVLRNFEQLQKRRRELDTSGHVIGGLLPSRSLGLVIGASGLGKSPLLVQLGLCVAAGVPFLDMKTETGDVLLLDFENGIGEVEDMLLRISEHLGPPSVPPNFRVWSAADCSQRFGQPGYGAEDVIGEWAAASEASVKLVLIDPLSALRPSAEDTNKDASKFIQVLRGLVRKHGVTILVSHHIRKPSREPSPTVSLADCTSVREWFNEARGASSLINGVDVRLGVDGQGHAASAAEMNGESREEIALILRGFRRVRGEIGPFYLARRFDQDGEPLGYRKLVSAELLFNHDQQGALARLPQKFTTGQAKTTYGRGDQATSDWLHKCERLGLARKVGRGVWEKVQGGGECGESS